MANLYSTQRTAQRATPATKQSPNERGKLMRYYFDYTIPTGDTGATDDIELVTIPKGSRHFGGMIYHTALATGGTPTLSIGIAGSVAIYAAAEAVTAAGDMAFGNTAALLFGEVASAEITFLATIAADGLAAAGTIQGYVDVLEP